MSGYTRLDSARYTNAVYTDYTMKTFLEMNVTFEFLHVSKTLNACKL